MRFKIDCVDNKKELVFITENYFFHNKNPCIPENQKTNCLLSGNSKERTP